MKILNMQVNNVAGIASLDLTFDPGMNIVCGPNGIGKTTVLECIGHCFSANQTSILKRSVSASEGIIKAEIRAGGQTHPVEIKVKEFVPGRGSQTMGLYTLASHLLTLKIGRSFQYQPLDSVSKDKSKDNNQIHEEAKSGIAIQEVKGWFVNRYLYSGQPGAVTSTQLHNLELAKKGFGILQDGFSFSRVLASSNEIMVNSPSGEIYYEYLSSGFKSCLAVFFGIIKEIEYRFTEEAIRADDFDGIILVDEIELHLHPEWQSKIPRLLQEMFPRAQFVVSTHSPHVIQSARPNEVVALEFDGSAVVRRALGGNLYGFQGWGIEDILIDVMGMRDVRTEKFRDAMAHFNQAIDDGETEVAGEIYGELDRLLHPSDVLRKLLKMQLASAVDD